MKSLRFGAIALTLAVLVAGCSQGISLQEYFSQMEQIAQGHKKKADALEKSADEEMANATDEAAQVALIQAFFADNLDLAESSLTGIQEVSPPSEVEEQHQAFLDAFESMVAAFQEASTSIEDASTGADVSAVIEEMGPQMEEISGEFDTACTNLQKIADENDIQANLDCGEGSDSGASPAPTAAPVP